MYWAEQKVTSKGLLQLVKQIKTIIYAQCNSNITLFWLIRHAVATRPRPDQHYDDEGFSRWCSGLQVNTLSTNTVIIAQQNPSLPNKHHLS